jgi:hypothetical protein
LVLISVEMTRLLRNRTRTEKALLSLMQEAPRERISGPTSPPGPYTTAVARRARCRGAIATVLRTHRTEVDCGGITG